MFLFGTDGIRGKSDWLISNDIAINVGRAVASMKNGATVVVAYDTRCSSPFLETQLVDGITMAGGTAVRCGRLPTPALAYLTKKQNADYGIMISASHNPPDYNGLKLFDCDGNKATIALEFEVEQIIKSGDYSFGKGKVFDCSGAKATYIKYIQELINCDFSGIKVTLDCCHGATAGLAGKVFTSLGADVNCLCNKPDGNMVNVYSGSTNPNYLKEHSMGDIGFSFDGDGDRVIGVDDNKQILNGDHFIYHIAKYMIEKGTLDPKIIVGTKMTNLSLVKTLNKQGVIVEISNVGDKYVLEKMKETGAVLGGEQSGHIIYKNEIMTGDGILAACMLTKIFKHGCDFTEFKPYPQILRNYHAKGEILNYNEVIKEIKKCEQILGDMGRVFVRASGTEPVIRVLVEAENQAITEMISDRLHEFFKIYEKTI